MPIYEYHCNKCNDIFEELIGMSAPDPPCPKCGENDVEKLISRSSFHLKGGGWYVTEYGKGNEGSSTQKTADDSTSAKTDKKSDSSAGTKKSTSKKSTESES